MRSFVELAVELDSRKAVVLEAAGKVQVMAVVTAHRQRPMGSAANTA